MEFSANSVMVIIEVYIMIFIIIIIIIGINNDYDDSSYVSMFESPKNGERPVRRT